MVFRQARILILCKTYPSPSAKHVETSCVAGLEAQGNLIRLYPVPFRLIGDAGQFKKWQWITARIEKSPNDHRPESHRIAVDTITQEGRPLPTRSNWSARRAWLDKIPIFDDFAQLQAAREERGVTLGIIRPSKVLGLDITAADPPQWTDEERIKLLQLQRQGNLFDATDASRIRTLRKVPFDFHYRYECSGQEGDTPGYRHKIVDWEVGALYWNVQRSRGANWQAALKEKLEDELPSMDLMFLMGTIHRFPKQWLIVSLLYPPRQRDDQPRQQPLL